MLIHALTGIALTIAVSLNPGMFPPEGGGTLAQLTAREKNEQLKPLVNSATDCLVHAVAQDPRVGRMQITDLIVDSFKNCLEPVRALIDAHDRYYGSGTGERFFMGPYLDALPATVTGVVNGKSR